MKSKYIKFERHFSYNSIVYTWNLILKKIFNIETNTKTNSDSCFTFILSYILNTFVVKLQFKKKIGVVLNILFFFYGGRGGGGRINSTRSCRSSNQLLQH